MAQIQNESRTSYVGVGRKQIIEQTFWQVPWWNQIDPLAQTFLFAGGTVCYKYRAVFRNKRHGFIGRKQLSSKAGYGSVKVMW